MQCFLLFFEAQGIVSSMISYLYISVMLTDKLRLTSLLVSFCRIHCVCCRFQELKKMGCFFLLVRSSISYTYAWPVFCWVTSPQWSRFLYLGHGPTFCLCLLSLCSTAIVFTAYLNAYRGTLEKCVLVRSPHRWFYDHTLMTFGFSPL